MATKAQVCAQTNPYECCSMVFLELLSPKTGCKVGAKGTVDFCQLGVDIWQIVVDVDGGGLFGFSPVVILFSVCSCSSTIFKLST